MRCSSTAGFGSFQDKAKQICFVVVALAGGHDGKRKEKASLVFFSAFLHFTGSLQIQYSNL